MRRFLIAAIILSAAVPAAAQLYKWVDKDGKTYYSDSPPPNQDTKRLSVTTGGETAAAPAAAPKTAVQRDKDLEKGRQDARDATKKADDAARMAANQAENCARMKGNYQQLVDGGRINRYNSKGEPELMSDEDIVKGREKARVEMDEACKK